MVNKFADLEYTIINQVIEQNNVLIKKQPQMLILKINRSEIVNFLNEILNFFPSNNLNGQYTIASFKFELSRLNEVVSTIEIFKFMYQVYSHSLNKNSSNHFNLNEFSFFNEENYNLNRTNNSIDNKQRNFNISLQSCQPKLAFFTNTNLQLEEYKLISEFISDCFFNCDTLCSYICLYLYDSKDIITKIDEYYSNYIVTSDISKCKKVFDLKESQKNNLQKTTGFSKTINYLKTPYSPLYKIKEKECFFEYVTLFYKIKYDIIDNDQFDYIKKPIDISLCERNLNSIYRLYFINFLGQQTIYFFVYDKINKEKIVYVSLEDSSRIKFEFLICKNIISDRTTDEEKDGMDNFVKNLTKLIEKNIKNFNDYKNKFNFNKTCFN
ncbi:hypothetical protein GVAV_001191 [Gurleya vavrai]